MRIVTRALAAAASAVVIGLATTTSAFAATVTTGETGTLVARGAAVDVPVSYTCDNASQVFIAHVTLMQRAGSSTTSGYGYSGANYISCDGLQGTTTVRVYAQGGLRAFKKGVATARPEIYICNVDEWGYMGECRYVYGNSTIKLR